MSETDGYGSTADNAYTELARLQQRTWIAAAPYLVAAVVAWIGAALAEYQGNHLLAQGAQLEQRLWRQTVLEVLSQALLFAGLGLFTVGLLVAALRQHERWRRDWGQLLAEPLDVDEPA